MEEWQQNHIETNLVELVKATLCNTILLARLTACRILSNDDVESLQLPDMTSFDKSMKLYKILKTRVGAYEVLLNGLEETRQTGAKRILDNTHPDFRTCGIISYNRNHVLGKGCSGTKVYLGKCGDCEAAIKVIHSEFIDPKLAHREVEILKKIDHHQNIIRYFFMESKNDLIFIALERCKISLQDEIKLNSFQMNPTDILKKCTKGLVHLHEHNIIHRDMKPANILFTENKQVKISDFGVSKQIPVGMTSVSLHSGVVGTADWMAPEVLKILNERTETGPSIRMSTSADVFSLGCIFVFTLTKGCHPFGETTSRQHNIRHNTPQLETFKIDNDWLHLVKKMISPLPSSRPSAKDVLTSNCFISIGTLVRKNELSSTVSCEESEERSHMLNEVPTVSNQVLDIFPLPQSTVTNLKMQGSDLKERPLDTFENPECGTKTAPKSSTTEIKPNIAQRTLSESMAEKIKKWNTIGTQKSAMEDSTRYQLETETSKENNRRSKLNELRHGKYNDRVKELLKLTGTYNNGDENKDDVLLTLVDRGVKQIELAEVVKLGGDWKITNRYGQSILHRAAEGGNMEALKYFVSLGADVHSRDNHQRTVLHIACNAKQNFTETIQFLVQHNLDINAVDWKGDNAVFLAAFLGRTKEELEEIVNMGGDWKTKNQYGHSILHRAAEDGNVEALKYFISIGADVHSRDNKQRTVLHTACVAKQNFTETLQFLVQNNLEINAVDCVGDNTVFLAACWGGTKEQLEEIVKMGGDWKTKNQYGHSILHRAADGGNVEALKYFISIGADVHSTDNEQMTVLHRACVAEQNFTEILQFLVQNNLEINAVDGNGDNTVFLASCWGRTKEELEDVVKMGGDWKIKNKYGQSILHRAAEGGNVEALKYFISLGADVDSRDNEQRTVLHMACNAKENFIETVQFLVQNNPEINAVDCDGDNAVFFATAWGRTKEELEEIVRLGGDWKIKNKYGHSILHRAAEGGNVEALKYFISIGEDVSCRSYVGETPLHRLVHTSINFKRCLEILHANGASLNVKTNKGSTLESILESAGKTEELNMLKSFY